jgi:hypothetical protein
MLCLMETIIGLWFFFGNVVCVPVKMGCVPLVYFLVEEMAQNPYEGCCEHFWSS